MSADSKSGVLPKMEAFFETQLTFFVSRLIRLCWSQTLRKSLSTGLCGPFPLLYVTVKPPVAWSRGCEVSGRDCVCSTKEAGSDLTFTTFFCTSEVLCLLTLYSVEMILHFVRWADSGPWWPLVLQGRCWWISWGSVQAAGISRAQGIG